MAENSELLTDMLDVLKDISAYLDVEKAEDATLEKTQLADKPKIGESQAKKDPISGGNDPNGKPGEDVIKAENDDDDEDEETEDEETEESEDDVEELKSLLKDIKSALAVNQGAIVKSITAELKKSMPSIVKAEIPGMLRKMGFSPSRPDVIRLGLDTTTDVRKSDDTAEEDLDVDIKKAQKAVEDLSKMSFSKLAQLRESMGDFNTFNR